MSTVSDKYIPEVAEVMTELKTNAEAMDRNGAQLAAYEGERDEVLLRLREKHGVVVLEAERQELMVVRSVLEDRLRRIRCAMVIGTVDLLLRTIPGRARELSVELGYQVPGLRLSDADTGRVSYDEAFHLLSMLVMDGWAGVKFDDRADSGVWVENGTVGIAVPLRLLDGSTMDRFLEWADGRLAEWGMLWAREKAVLMTMDRERRRALLKVLTEMKGGRGVVWVYGLIIFRRVCAEREPAAGPFQYRDDPEGLPAYHKRDGQLRRRHHYEDAGTALLVGFYERSYR